MPPLAYSIPEACKCSNAGRTTVYKAINAGDLTAHKRGSRTIILSSDLERWLSSLPQIEAKHFKQTETVVHAAPQNGSMLDPNERVYPTKKEINQRERRGAV
jgi:excisionase family DNA binding protein